MRRIQLYVGDEADDALALEAHRRGVSKAALIREAVDARYLPRSLPSDPWDALTGWLEGEAIDDLDAVIYATTE